MSVYDYAIAIGSDQTTLTNVEDIITYAPMGKPIPLGSVRRKTLNQQVQTNGTKVITWSFAAMSFDDFEALVEFIWGDFDTENAAVTIQTRGRDEDFHRGNATAILPAQGDDYQRRDHGSVENLVITFLDYQELSDGFTTGFSFGFEA